MSFDLGITESIVITLVSIFHVLNQTLAFSLNLNQVLPVSKHKKLNFAVMIINSCGKVNCGSSTKKTNT